jgi:hypothetical protein
MKELLREFFASILNEKTDDGLVTFGQTTIDGEPVYVYGPKTTPESGRKVADATHFAKKGDTKNKQQINAQQKKQIAKGDVQSTEKDTQKTPAQRRTTKSTAGNQPEKADVAGKVSKLISRRYKIKGKLLSGSKSAQDILEKGFVPGKGAPPGNPGSVYNENMSNEGVKLLELYPDLSEEALTRIIFERTRRTKLGRQQKDTSIVSKVGLPLPDDIRKLSPENRVIYKNALITARSARQKFDRARQGSTAATRNGFGSKYKHQVFGGAKTDLEAAKSLVQKAPRVFVYDEELGVVEVPKEEILKWISESGGGENAADTMVITVDAKGNVVYDGWSDKKTLKDIQGNSTLNEEYNGMAGLVVDLQTQDLLDKDTAVEAVAILQGAQLESDNIEKGYSDVSRTLSTYFLDRKKELNRYGKMSREQKETKKHFGNWLRKIQAVKNGEMKSSKYSDAIKRGLQEVKKLRLRGEAVAFYILCQLAQEGLLTADDRKILERTAAAERKAIASKNSGTLPKEHKGLAVEDALSDLRLDVINLQRDTVKKLNQRKVKTRSGKTVKLGDYLKAREIIAFLHLDKINMPKGKGDHRQVLRRNTQLILEGIPVSPKKLRSCIGVKNTREFEDNFEVRFDDDDTNTVYIYSINKEGKRVLIAKKVYRSKTGLTGATGTTIEWTKDMQTCFDSK